MPPVLAALTGLPVGFLTGWVPPSWLPLPALAGAFQANALCSDARTSCLFREAGFLTEPVAPSPGRVSTEAEGYRAVLASRTPWLTWALARSSGEHPSL